MTKTVTGMGRVKRAYVRTKETVENAQPQEKRHASPIEYAEDKTERGADRAAHEAAHQAGKQGSRLVDKAEEKHRISKETKEIRRSARGEGSSPLHGEPSASPLPATPSGRGEPYQPKEQIRKKGTKAGREKGCAEESRRAESHAEGGATESDTADPKQTIKTIDRGEKTAAVLILIIVLLFGGLLCMVGGGNSSTVSPVSAEVEAYEPVIRLYANQYGIGEYVELIKAVMMQESGGQGSDPMQSSESGYNTRYPREPNGITDSF